MLRADKVDLVQDVTQKLNAAQSAVLVDFKGITVAEMTKLRTQLREQSVEMRVIKNRLLKRALAATDYESLDDLLEGPTAVGFGVKDPVAVAKILHEYARSNGKLEIKGGLLEGRRLDKAGVESLAKMPGREELLGRMAGDLKQPGTKMARAFNGMILKVGYAFNALAQKKEAAGEAA